MAPGAMTSSCSNSRRIAPINTALSAETHRQSSFTSTTGAGLSVGTFHLAVGAMCFHYACVALVGMGFTAIRKLNRPLPGYRISLVEHLLETRLLAPNQTRSSAKNECVGGIRREVEGTGDLVPHHSNEFFYRSIQRHSLKRSTPESTDTLIRRHLFTRVSL